ncbi:MAG TPA: hypothetical protein VEA99_07615 [Gemmatimonadaceae bacterium]|nr:hypothetical protein [Gemmatimonadaceae bacterium]
MTQPDRRRPRARAAEPSDLHRLLTLRVGLLLAVAVSLVAGLVRASL